MRDRASPQRAGISRWEVIAGPVVLCASVIAEAGRGETVAALDVIGALKRENYREMLYLHFRRGGHTSSSCRLFARVHVTARTGGVPEGNLGSYSFNLFYFYFCK